MANETTADTICHICGIRLGDRGSEICSAVHGEAAWGKSQTTKIARGFLGRDGQPISKEAMIAEQEADMQKENASGQTTAPMGALPPPDATIQIGDRADKVCILAAMGALSACGRSVLFHEAQAAVDAYLATAARQGWKLWHE